MRETWKEIKGFEGLYEISNLGNVRGRKGLLKKALQKKRISVCYFKERWQTISLFNTSVSRSKLYRKPF